LGVPDCLMWIVGDWLLAGESAGYLPRGKLGEACETFGIEYQTAKQAVRVCRAYERCVRTHHLTFTHHAVVARRPDATDLLEWAEENEASVLELRAEKRGPDIDPPAPRASGAILRCRIRHTVCDVSCLT